MKSRPFIVKVVSLYLVLIPIMMLIYVRSFAHWQWDKILSIVKSPVGWLLPFLYIVAYGLWRVRAWGYYSFLALCVTIVALDLGYSLRTYGTPTKWMVFDLAMILVGLYIFQKRNVREPYFNPKIRWWEEASRHRIDIYGRFEKGEKRTDALILDISSTGCFVNFNNDWQPDEHVRVSFHFAGVDFETPAVIVRESENPKGSGLRFEHMTIANWWNLRSIVSSLTQLEKFGPIEGVEYSQKQHVVKHSEGS